MSRSEPRDRPAAPRPASRDRRRAGGRGEAGLNPSDSPPTGWWHSGTVDGLRVETVDD